VENSQRHGAQYETAGAYGPEAVAASLARGDGGFGRNQETYFDHPILRKAHWRWQIVLYFFVGGASAASAALASIADLSGDTGDRQLVRNGRYTALAGSALSSLLLVSDLGRPERFLNMMRIAKLKSPMSVGVYTLITFSTTAALAALEQFHIDGHITVDPFGWIPKRLRLTVSSISAAYLACYTAVLVSATAIPVWYTGRRHIPPIFVLSAMSTGSAMQSILLAIGGPSPRTMKKLETIELVASLAEASMLLNFERHAGEVGRPLFRGMRGKRLKTFTMVLGIALPALINLPSVLSRKPAQKPHRLRTLLTSALVLAGGYVLRESVIAAGRDSADDPRAYLRHPE
jgi:formate-dependent nitrite reductase membrane component NrfD